MDFYRALAQVYRQSPCEVLPNAFWKTKAELTGANVAFRAAGSQVKELKMWEENRLLVYWIDDPRQADFSFLDLDRMRLALVHARLIPYFPAVKFPHQEAYFRYVHPLEAFSPADAPEGYSWRPALPDREADEIAGFIDACYPNISPTGETVLGWAAHPVYDPDLWLWLVDDVSGQPAALGIAELDPAVEEGSLEWVQVLPAYRRNGLGKAVVMKLLEGLAGKAQFATVSGEVENPSHPGSLYRRCGFMGEDIWWMLHK